MLPLPIHDMPRTVERALANDCELRYTYTVLGIRYTEFCRQRQLASSSACMLIK